MSSDEPMPLGDALRWFRARQSINQTEAGLRMGLSERSAQTGVSQREQRVGHPDYTEVRIIELYRLERASGVELGTILRHAGYVSDGEVRLPLGISPCTERAVRTLLDNDAALADPPLTSPSTPRRRGRVDNAGA